ncbi:MAG: hypothetical protein AAB403_06570, partial [Planctomycetota bacterium]
SAISKTSSALNGIPITVLLHLLVRLTRISARLSERLQPLKKDDGLILASSSEAFSVARR